jgi:hypothetical protein
MLQVFHEEYVTNIIIICGKSNSYTLFKLVCLKTISQTACLRVKIIKIFF